MTNDDHQRNEKRKEEHYQREEKRKWSESDVDDEEDIIIIHIPRPTKNPFLGKGEGKIHECESQYLKLNPNHASSSSSSPYLQLNLNYTSSSSNKYSQLNPNHASSSLSPYPKLNPNHASSSSSSLSLVEPKRLHVVSNKPKREPIIRETVRKELVRREPTRRESVRDREAGREKEQVIERKRVLANVMSKVEGGDAKLFVEKKLTPSDVNHNLGRLLIPFLSINDMSFLEKKELKIIDQHVNKKRDKGLDVILIDPRGEKFELNLRRWDMNTSPNYTLVSGWNKVTQDNSEELKAGNKISLWSFRSRGRLYFALVPPALAPPPAPVLAQPPPPPLLSLEELLEAHPLKDEKEREKDGRIFVKFPWKRRTPRVEIPAPATVVSDFSNVEETRLAMDPLENVQETNRDTTNRRGSNSDSSSECN